MHEVELAPSKCNPVIEFLQEHGLAQYADAFMSSGFDEMESLLDADDADLKDLGVPRGHALKLKRYLCEYTGGIGSSSCDEEGLTKVSDAKLSVKPASVSLVQRRVSIPSLPVHSARSRLAVHHLEASETMKGDVQESW